MFLNSISGAWNKLTSVFKINVSTENYPMQHPTPTVRSSSTVYKHPTLGMSSNIYEATKPIIHNRVIPYPMSTTTMSILNQRTPLREKAITIYSHNIGLGSLRTINSNMFSGHNVYLIKKHLVKKNSLIIPYNIETKKYQNSIASSLYDHNEVFLSLLKNDSARTLIPFIVFILYQKYHYPMNEDIPLDITRALGMSLISLLAENATENSDLLANDSALNKIVLPVNEPSADNIESKRNLYLMIGLLVLTALFIAGVHHTCNTDEL